MVPDERDPPVTPREQVLGGERAAADVVDDDARQPRMRHVDQHGRQTLALERLDLLVDDRQRDHEQARDAVAAAEVAHRVGALLGRLDVEQQQVIAAAGPSRSTTPRTRSTTDGVVKNGTTTPIACTRPIDEVARRRVEPVPQLLDGGAHPRARLLDHQRAVVEHARHRRHAHAGVPRDVADRRRRHRERSVRHATSSR